MAGAERQSALEDQLEEECGQLAQTIGCTPVEARAFLLSQPSYYARLCPMPKGLFVSPLRRRHVARLRHQLNARSPRLSAPDGPLLTTLEAEVATIEFAGKAPPLATRTQIRRELLRRGLAQKSLRKAFSSLAVVRSNGLGVRRAPHAGFVAAATIGHHGAAICGLVLLLAAFGRAVTVGCVGCSELGLIYLAMILGWLSRCFFLFGPDWINSDRLLLRLGL